jgi:hypothetical protein
VTAVLMRVLYVNIMVPDMAEQVTFGIFFKLYVVDGSLTFQHL